MDIESYTGLSGGTLRNAVTGPIAYQIKEVCGSPSHANNSANGTVRLAGVGQLVFDKDPLSGTVTYKELTQAGELTTGVTEMFRSRRQGHLRHWAILRRKPGA